MSKKTILILIAVLVIVIAAGFIAYNLLNPKYVLIGRITDAENGQGVPGVKVQAGQQEAFTDENGAFVIRRVKTDTQFIITVPPEYQPVTETVDYQSGTREGLFSLKITKDVELTPTSEEKVNRVKRDVEAIVNAVKSGKFEEAYNAMHPDSQKLISKEEYVKRGQDASKSVRLTDYKIGDVRLLDQWHSDELNRDYSNVAEVEMTFTYTGQALGISQTVDRVVHCAIIDGKCRWFYSPDSSRAI